MDIIEKKLAGVSRLLDYLAGWVLVSVMLLVVTNVVLRVFFKSPLLGTYEFVGFLTASFIGLALAYCAYQDFHISVGYFLERLPPRIQGYIELVTGAFSLVFLSLASWHLVKMGQGMVRSGVVSPTTKTPYYPVVFLVSLGFLVLALVVLVKMRGSLEKALTKKDSV